MNDIYKRLSDLAEPVRTRLLRLVETEELSVSELVRITQLPQSTVSRHLKHLVDGGWILRRSEGPASYFRVEGMADELAAIYALVRDVDDVATAEDGRRLAVVLAERDDDAAGFFGRHAASWDEVRRDLFGESYVLPTLLTLLDVDVVADLGCGTGAVVAELAGVLPRVIGVDREGAMLEAAGARLVGVDNVELRQGSFDALPLEASSLDAATCMLALHHVRDLRTAFGEFARVLRPGARLIVLDMVRHDRVAYARRRGHVHLGFAPDDLDDVLPPGLERESYRVLPADPSASGPALFVAAFRRQRT